MLYPSIDELKKRADSRYTLVMLASKRSRDLIDGYPPLVNIGNEKPVSIATEEIARDMISYKRKLWTDDEEQVTEEDMLSGEWMLADSEEEFSESAPEPDEEAAAEPELEEGEDSAAEEMDENTDHEEQ